MSKDKKPISIKNRKAYHEFFIDKTYEAGIELKGTEVKSIRAGHVGFTDSFAFMLYGELWLKQLYIKEFEHGSYNNHDAYRDRRLLLTKDELSKIDRALKQKNYTIVPLSIYFKRGWAKVQIGLARGKKSYDKRATIAEKDVKRDLERKLKDY